LDIAANMLYRLK
jgi:transposase